MSKNRLLQNKAEKNLKSVLESMETFFKERVSWEDKIVFAKPKPDKETKRK